MKIEKLAFKNINSLAGEFEIDFLNPALTQSSMFVITGPTGAGKTTILDAVSFALFGYTPRQEDAPGQERNEIMTHGTGECYATVYFEQDGERYRSTVSHKRTKAGDKFGTPKYELYRLSGNDEWQMLTNQAKAFRRLIQEIIGLNFENFKRSVLLAQGEFAAFLKAGDTERAEVLSTITGTEIYDRIGRIAHEHVASVQRQIEDLKPEKEMLPEKRKQTEASLDAASNKLQEIEASLKHVVACIQWIESEARLKKIAEAAERKALDAAQAMKEFNEKSAPLLKRAESALQLKPQGEQLGAAMKQHKKSSEEAATLAACLNAEQAALEQYTKLAKQTQAEMETVAPVLQKQLDEVQEEMRPMETRLGMLKKDVDSKGEAALQHQRNAASLTSRLEKLAALLKSEQTAFLKHREELEMMSDAATLGERLPLIKARLKDWMSAAKDAPEELLPHAQIESALEAAQVALAEAEPIPASLRTIAELKRAQLDIEDKLAALYLDFREGKLDCCPCCGSKTPGERHAVRNDEVKAAEDAVLQAENAVKACLRRVKNLEAMLRVSFLRQEFVAALGTEVETLSAALQQVKTLEQRYGTFSTLQVVVQTNEKKCADLKSEFDKESARAEEVKRAAEESARQLAEAKDEYTALHVQFIQRWGTGVSSATLAEQISDKLASLKKKAQSSQDLLNAARIKETEIRSAHEQIAGRLQELTKSVAEQKKAFERLLKEHSFADARDYVDAVNNDMPRRGHLQTRLNQLNGEEKTSAALREREAAALAELQAQCPLQEGEAAESLAEKQAQLKEVHRQCKELHTTLLAELCRDDLAHEKNREIAAERERLQSELNKHALLKKVLGDSQEGFKKFAQQITFDLLLEQANVELRKFTNRFELRRSTKDKKLLDISVIDHELGIVEGRSASNLSGGESFLVSLSLALGLSHLSQSTRIDSLFLDEGFGTLDADTLEQVVSSLQKLHETGKTIGIISHVPALSERIPARIEVQRTREGFSTLTGNPAVKCLKA